MDSKILDGREVAKKIEARVLALSDDYYNKYGSRPVLAIIMVGDNEASKVYVKW